MTIVPKATSKSSPVKAMSQAGVYGERAMAMMNSLKILPTPQNYGIFFAVAAGQPG